MLIGYGADSDVDAMVVEVVHMHRDILESQFVRIEKAVFVGVNPGYRSTLPIAISDTNGKHVKDRLASRYDH